jgi:hypothetical protein
MAQAPTICIHISIGTQVHACIHTHTTHKLLFFAEETDQSQRYQIFLQSIS